MGIQATVEVSDLHAAGLQTSLYPQEGWVWDETGEEVYDHWNILVVHFDSGDLFSYCEDVLCFDCRNVNHQFLAEMDRKKIPYVKG